MNTKLKELLKKALTLPSEPGVYIMKDQSKNIIYIGKSKSLKNRVSQYFTGDKNHAVKVQKMVSQVDSFEYIITDSEFEALVLECSLIKQHKPKYNILLKDDKGYHYIKVTSEDWPTISVVKQKIEDGSVYIGPYTSSWSVKKAVDEVLKIFKLPSCNLKFPRDIKKRRPCLNYYINQCFAPCNGKVTMQQYNETINEALQFLKGSGSFSVKELTKEMNLASDNMNFEKAAKIRDRITAIKRINDKQKVVAQSVQEQDVIALAKFNELGCFEIFRFENGRMFNKEEFITENISDDKVSRTEFIQQYYSIRDKIPAQITIDSEIDSKDAVIKWLSEKANKKVKIKIPKQGEQLKLVSMCYNNAMEALAQYKSRAGRESTALQELTKLLGLSKEPVYIEAYDVSNIAGDDNVAAMVVFENGKPLKTAYKRFEIKGFKGQDDYESMREVIYRRFCEYKKLEDTNDGFGKLPDLILLDGGKGHISAVKSVLEEFNLHRDIPIFGMVKDNKHKTRAIAEEGGEISINSNRQAFTLISSIQEEVHRFAINYHRAHRKKRVVSTELSSINGIGDARAKSLLKHFCSIKRIKEASIEELLNVKGMTKTSAISVYNYFNNNKNSDNS